MSQNTSSAVMQQRKEPHDSLDDFPTPTWGVRALCQCLNADLSRKRVWEPACNRGFMTRGLAEYFEVVYASDIHDYGHGQVFDFLWPYEGPTFDWIITNPPFRLAEQFAITAIERATEGVALLVRSAFLEGIGRYDRLFSKYPPSAIMQFTERLPMIKGRVSKEASTATSYAWLVWSCRPHKPAPIDVPAFYWIPPCRKRLERPEDYEAHNG